MNFYNQKLVNHFLAPQLDAVGEDFQVWHPRYLQLTGTNILVGSHVHVMALRDNPVRMSSFGGVGRISVGNYCIVNPGVRIISADNISIGDSCMLAMNVHVTDADWHDTQYRIYAPGKTATVTLERDVWVGDSVFIGKGVTVGENAIVGAYSVVTSNIEANSIVRW